MWILPSSNAHCDLSAQCTSVELHRKKARRAVNYLTQSADESCEFERALYGFIRRRIFSRYEKIKLKKQLLRGVAPKSRALNLSESMIGGRTGR
jgi:hypothetical protein